ncbi:MAG: hypothetical protein J6L69_07115 [Lachnospiraceae bacterium]|nr:hypothetical protein [Lachnospiraceae bacterium]
MKNIFNFKLFKEALKQIRIQFFLCLGVLLGIAGITVFVLIAESIKSYQYTPTIDYISAADAYGHLHIIYAIAIPVFTIKLFKFLTKRNASDFYHAIPQKRICLFVTYSLAILAASVVLLIIATAVPTIAFLFAHKYIKVIFLPILTYMLNIFVCTLLTLSIMLLACAMTGTTFTSFVFTLVLLIGPRFVIALISECITSNFDILLPMNADFGIFSNSINLVWNQIYWLLAYEEDSIFAIGIPTLYTFVLAAIYYVLAILMFNRRRSEQAENSLNNPFAHHAIRTCIGFVSSIFIALSLYNYEMDEIDTYVIMELLIYIFVTICAMTIYEMLTTKKAKNLLNVLKSIPIVAILCILVVVALKVSENNILNYEPNASKISYVKIKNGGSEYGYYNDFNHYDEDYYYDYVTSKIKYNDEKIIDFVTEQYNEELERFKEAYQSDNYQFYRLYEYYHSKGELYQVTIEFNQFLNKAERIIHLTESEYQELCELMHSNEEYKEIRYSLPKNYYVYENNCLFTSDELQEITDVLNDEIKDLPMNELETVLNNHNYDSNNAMSFYATTYVDSAEYRIDIYLNKSTPKTLETMFEILDKKATKQSDSLDKVCDIYSNLNDYTTDDIYCHLNFMVYNIKSGELEYTHRFYPYYTGIDFEEQMKDEINGIITLIKERTDYEDSSHIVFIDGNYTINNSYNRLSTYFFTDAMSIASLFEKVYNTYE